jgi:hypothetical protein
MRISYLLLLLLLVVTHVAAQHPAGKPTIQLHKTSYVFKGYSRIDKTPIAGKVSLINGLDVFHNHYHYSENGLTCYDKCVLDKKKSPPYRDLIKAIYHAKLITDSHGTDNTDTNHVNYDVELDTKFNKWLVAYYGRYYVILEKDGIIHKLVSRHLLLEFMEIKMSLKTNTKKCQQFNHKIQTTEASTLWYTNKQLCKIKNIRGKNCGQNAPRNEDLLQATRKTCIFLHGAGHGSTKAPTPTYHTYWGYIENYTPYCKEHWFIREDTKTRGWDNIELQKAYCKLALMGNEQSDNTIKNKVLIVHSMGNLILAAALKNGFCQIDIQSTTWYNSGGPLLGSKAADVLDDVCQKAHSGYKPGIYKYIAEKGGYCVPGTNRTYPVYKSLETTYPGLKELSFAKSFMTGSMCGDSAWGLNSKYAVVLYLLSKVVEYGDPNDGMVDIYSCSIGKNYTKDYKAMYYMVDGNHADITCMNKDGYWGKQAAPCSYFLNKY